MKKICRFNFDFDTEREKRCVVCRAEGAFRSSLNRTARRLTAYRPQIITLSGPTCSGKTTTAETIIGRLTGDGMRVRQISVDDFYRENELDRPLTDEEKQKQDWETFASLDADYLRSFTSGLLSGKKVLRPIYDFTVNKRRDYEEIDPRDYDVFLFEGIQALYPEVTAMFGKTPFRSVFISVASDLTVNGVSFTGRELRFLRRLVRDDRTRGASAELTYSMWQKVVDNELKNVEPYAAKTDMHLDSMMAYEPFVIRDDAIRVLSQIGKGSPFASDAAALTEKLEKLPSLESSCIPEDSVFREFIGKESDIKTEK